MIAIARPMLTGLQTALVAQGDRAPSWLVLCFALGVAVFFAWPSDPSPWIAPLGIVLTVPAAVLLDRGGRLAALFAAALVAGFGCAHMRTAMVGAPILDRELRRVSVEGRVAEVQRQPNFIRAVLDGVVIQGGVDAVLPTSIRLTTLSRHGAPRVGERIAVTADLRPPDLPPVPGGFQFQRFLFFDGIGATAFTVAPWRTVDGGISAQSGLRDMLESLRRRISDRILAAVPGDAGAVAVALITGEQSLIREQVQDDYRASGLAHLLSISGVHMSLLAAVVFVATRRLLALWPAIALRHDIKKFAAIAALAATLFYLSISGLSVPAVRAFMMVAVVLTAVLLDRRALSLRSVSWAALAVLAIYPESLVGPSFQMSFLAVTALIALYEHYALQPHWRDRDGRWRLSHGLKVYVGGLVATDIVAGSVTSLLAAYHFSNLPAYSAIGNLVAAPITGLWIMPWGLIGLALMPLGFDAGALGLMGVGIDGLNRLAAAIATWPSAQVHVPPMSMAALTAAALGVLFVSLWRGAWRWIGLAPILFAVAQPWAARPPDLLVAPDGGLLAVTDDAGALVMSPGRNERFVRSVWIERFGRGPARWPDASGLRCDSNGCVLDRNGARTTVAFTRDAVVEDCGRSRLIVAPDLFVDDCRGSVVVDRRDVLRDGAHAFTLDGGQVSIDSVRDHIGTRRWNRDLGPRRPIPISSGGTDPPDDPGP